MSTVSAYAPTKECPVCGDRMPCATRQCDCGHLFYESKAFNAPPTVTYNKPVDADAIRDECFKKCLPQGFEFWGQSQIGPNTVIVSASHPNYNAGKPILAPNITALMDACWSYVHGKKPKAFKL